MIDFLFYHHPHVNILLGQFRSVSNSTCVCFQFSSIRLARSSLIRFWSCHHNSWAVCEFHDMFTVKHDREKNISPFPTCKNKSFQIYCWWKKSCSRLFGIFSISISRLLSSKVAFLAAKSSLKSFTWIFHNQNLHGESCDSRVSNRHYILWRNGNMCVTCFFWSSLPAKHNNTSWSDVSVTVASIWPNAHVLHSEMITVAYVASKHAT